MDRSFSVKRQLVLVGLGLLLAADLTLAGYSLQASTALRTPMAQLDADPHKLGLLNADIERAEKIRHDLPLQSLRNASESKQRNETAS